MRSKLIAILAGLAFIVVSAAIFAPEASAHNGTITITCTKVVFSYTSFPSGQSLIKETVTINGSVVASKTFTLNGPSGTDTVSINAQNGDNVSATAKWTADGGGSASASMKESGCTPPPPKCPPGTSPNFRWHYSANGSSGSWSGTQTSPCPGSLSMGPQSMEGDLKVSPGTTLLAGYDFTVPGNNSPRTLTVNNPTLTFTVKCVSGASPSASTFKVSMPTATYSFSDSQWYPSGDQSSSAVYQGSISVPNLCGGGQLRLNQGATFTASLS